MRIDDADQAALPCRNERTWATTAALDPPSTMSSTKRRMAISASVFGTKLAPAASGVSQLRRQARRESLATALRKAERSPRSSPSEEDDDDGTACIATEARDGEKSLQGISDTGRRPNR